MRNGFVALVGAGPGNVGLLTVRGKQLLQQAEVVVYDRLVSDEILQLIPKDAVRIDVGKQSGNHPVPQEEINEILLREAQKGYAVVRLKGGDSFVFGRGGEELALLCANDISFEVVPGITSAIAAPAFAGIPVTHRDFASSLHLITAHQKKNEPLHLDFEALVRLNGTLVFLMGVSALATIAQGLLQAGLAPNTPAALVENGTRATQRKVTAPLAEIVQAAQQAQIASPAVIIVGEVCGLSNDFDWFTRLPLFGKTVVVTRPQDGEATLPAKLRSLGAQVTELPCIALRPLPCAQLAATLKRLTAFTWLVFTSKKGVSLFFEALQAAGADARSLAHCRIAAVGKPTANALRAYGICADMVPQVYTGKSLGDALAAQCTAQDSVLLLRAKNGTPDVAKALTAAKIPYEDIALYESVPIFTQAYNAPPNALVAFTSASAVEGFVASCTPQSLAAVQGVCIGPATAAACAAHGIAHVVATEATLESLTQKILEVTAHDT